MLKRIVAWIIAAVVMATAAGIVAVAASFALYALVRTYLVPAGAAAVVAAVYAVLLALVALILVSSVGGRRRRRPAGAERDTSLGGRLFEAVRQRPVVGAGAALAAALLAWRNPQLVATILRLLAPRSDRERL